VLWGNCLRGSFFRIKVVLIFDLPIKRVKAEHFVRCIPLRLFIRGLEFSNLILCMYAVPRGEGCYCVVSVLSALLVEGYLCIIIRSQLNFYF
jgi:hypothetical protein